MMDDDVERVWREIGRIETCMMITLDGESVRCRPMVGTPDPEAGTIWFVTRRSDHKDCELRADPRVCLAYVDPRTGTYVSISGTADVLSDRSRLRDVWTPSIDAWFGEGPDDPEAVLLAVHPECAEYWDNASPNLLVALEALTAAGRHEPGPALAEHVKVRL
ncbi:putative general stress protein [Stappia sp. 22II-S9-Z10]|nr:putative general stress protein [Stappia sp. 22II-S9-Z10]